jgi:hypothetical protein
MRGKDEKKQHEHRMGLGEERKYSFFFERVFEHMEWRGGCE